MEDSRRWLLRITLAAVVLLASNACNPPPVVDLPGSSLVAKATVIDTEANPSDGKVPIGMQFFSNGTFVELAANATISCNGTVLPWNGLGYLARVPVVAPGSTYVCTHVRLGVTSTLVVTVPARPVILSPAAGASVSRSASLAVTYVPDGGTGIRPSAGDGSTGLGGNVQPDSGSSSIDASSLKPGPGSIGVVREFTFTSAGGGFQSATIVYSSGSDIDVTWV
jgi:hypothetical protein